MDSEYNCASCLGEAQAPPVAGRLCAGYVEMHRAEREGFAEMPC
jgi:hypothetical protein